jgi:HlyD family secretion protein
VTFGAHVTHIADQAEFTPRNVQTVEGRSATVYAIKLAVTDEEGRLKPGMPADVSFEQ